MLIEKLLQRLKEKDGVVDLATFHCFDLQRLGSEKPTWILCEEFIFGGIPIWES